MNYLSRKGHRTSRISCNGAFQSSCPAFNELGIKNTREIRIKNSVCRSCKKRRNLLEEHFDYSSLNFDEVIDPKFINKVESLLKEVTPHNWMDFKVENVEFGKLASYEFSLHHKEINREIPQVLFGEYLNYLRTTLISYYGGLEVLSKTRPDIVVFYNSLYSINDGYQQAAYQLSINTYTIQSGPHLVDRPKTLSLFRSTRNLYEMPYSDAWLNYSKKPLTSNKIDEVHSHLLALLDGISPWAYSAPIGSVNAEAFPKNAILVLTSSEDELEAGRLVEAFPILPIRPGFASQTVCGVDIRADTK
jgi:hypothetical protein